MDIVAQIEPKLMINGLDPQGIPALALNVSQVQEHKPKAPRAVAQR